MKRDKEEHMDPIPQDFDTPASGVAVTAIGADHGEVAPLPAPPGEQPSSLVIEGPDLAAWLAENAPSEEVPALAESMIKGGGELDGLAPRAVEVEMARVTPRELPAVRPAPSRLATIAPPRPSLPWVALAFACAVVACGLGFIHVLTVPAPPETPGEPVVIGPAVIECLAAEPEAAMTEAASPVQTWSCKWGGKGRCVAPLGCQVYTWQRDPSASGWAFIAHGDPFPIGVGLWQRIAPAAHAVAKLERP